MLSPLQALYTFGAEILDEAVEAESSSGLAVDALEVVVLL